MAGQRLKRIRRRVRLLALFSLLIGVFAVAGADTTSDTAPSNRLHLSLECLPFTMPQVLAQLNRIITQYRAVPGFVGADV